MSLPVSRKDFCRLKCKTKFVLMSFVITINQLIPFIYQILFNGNMDLLLISSEFKSHYVYIKDFDRFMFNKTKNKGKKCFCKNCLHFFRSEKQHPCPIHAASALT